MSVLVLYFSLYFFPFNFLIKVFIDTSINYSFWNFILGTDSPNYVYQWVGNLELSVHLYWKDVFVTHICIVTLVYFSISFLQDVLLPLFFSNFFLDFFLFENKVSVFFLVTLIFGAILHVNLMNCYVFFKRWLFPSLLFSCLRNITFLSHLEKINDLNFCLGLFPSWLTTLSPKVCLFNILNYIFSG